MFVDVALTHVEVNHIDLSSYGAVAVIDILRATTTILTALENGARGVVPVSTPEEATMWRNQHHNVVLGGERGAKRIDGFDLGNSPLEYSPMTVAGKIVVLTTTNGTQSFQRVSSIGPGGRALKTQGAGHGRGPGAIHAAGPAIGDHSHAAAEEGPAVYAACLRNAAAVAAALVEDSRRTGRGALIVCSGTDGRFSREDAYGAAVILSRVEGLTDVTRGDGAEAVARLGALASDPMHELCDGFHGRRLLAMGLRADMEFCAEIDVSVGVPRLFSGMLVLAGT